MASSKSKTAQTHLICTGCKNVQTIRRRLGKQKADGHIKHLWCIHCKAVTAHTETKHEWRVKEMGAP